MATDQKHPIRDLVINIVLIGATAGILFYRWQSCKRQEEEQQRRADTARVEAEQNEKKRLAACLEQVPANERTACMECACKRCFDEVQACRADPQCKPSAVAEALPADASVPLSRVRMEAQLRCMSQQCFDACLAAPTSPDGG